MDAQPHAVARSVKAVSPGTADERGSDTAPGSTLQRSFGVRSLVLFGLGYMTPLIVLGTFGLLAATSDGAAAGAYALAFVAIMFTAGSYALMARTYPVAGSAYTYVRRAIDSRVGFLVGWAILLDYVFIPMVIWLIGAAFLSSQYPGVPNAVWIVGFIVLTSAVNIIGVKLADGVNALLMVFQLAVLATFVALSVKDVLGGAGEGTLLSSHPFYNTHASVPAIAAAAAVAAYSFLGFDTVTTLTDETVNPRRAIPRAIMLTAAIGGAIFVAVAYATQLVHPGGSFADSSSAASEIARQIGGRLFASVFLAGLVAAQSAAGLAAQAGASRLLHAMGRDGVLPRRVFGVIHGRFKTPTWSIAMCGAIGLIALDMSVTTSTSFINFGAFSAFTMVNISVVATFLRDPDARGTRNVAVWVLAPLIGTAVDVYLLTKLDERALTLGATWLGLGIIVLACLTRMFHRQPPELQYAEEETT